MLSHMSRRSQPWEDLHGSKFQKRYVEPGCDKPVPVVRKARLAGMTSCEH